MSAKVILVVSLCRSLAVEVPFLSSSRELFLTSALESGTVLGLSCVPETNPWQVPRVAISLRMEASMSLLQFG